MSDFRLLKNLLMFKDLNEESLQKIYKIWHEKEYKKGSIIFMEGDPGVAFYYIISGKVKLYTTSCDGREHIINIFGDGCVFGEATLLTGIDYPATAETLEDSKIGVLKNNDLENLIKEDTSLALEIIKVLSRRLIMASRVIRNMAFKDTAQRTAAALFELSQNHGVNTHDGIELNLEITRQELADVVGASRESISRVLSRLKKNGIIDINSNITIKDIKKLNEWTK